MGHRETRNRSDIGMRGKFLGFPAQLVRTEGETLPMAAQFLPDFCGGSSSFHQKDHRAQGVTDLEVLQQLEYHKIME